MFYWAFVCLSLSLSVCWQLYVKVIDRITMKILLEVYHVDREELVKFWRTSASGSGSRNFPKDSSTLRDMAFIPLFGPYL